LQLLKCREFFVTVDNFSIWKRHLAWAKTDGKDLRDYMTQRYASSMVFMSLLLSTELGVLFNSAEVTTDVRHALMDEKHTSIAFWAGISMILSAILTLLGLISTFTAWTMVSSVSEENAHCIFRSSIGQYCAELPGRLIVGSIYSFLAWLIMFFFLLLPFGFWSMLLMVVGVGLFVHVISSFSAFGRVIMHTGAMGSHRIFDPAYESGLLPHTLHTNLLIKARANLSNSTSIRRQYRSCNSPIDRTLSEDELSVRLNSEISNPNLPLLDSAVFDDVDVAPVRKRTESLVKFSDGYDTQGDPITIAMTPRNREVVLDLKTPVSALSNGSSSPRQQQRPPRRPHFVTPRSADTSIPFGTRKDPFRTTSSAAVDKWLQTSADDDVNGLPRRFRDNDPQAPIIEVGNRFPSQVSQSRASSAASTLDGTGTLGDVGLRVSEEEFESLFDPELSLSDDDGASQIVGWDIEEESAERTSLLKDDNMERGDYSSFQRSGQRRPEPG
jgi:hypothetical protein